MASFLPEWRRDALEKNSVTHMALPRIYPRFSPLSPDPKAPAWEELWKWMPATKGCPNGLAIGSERPLLPPLGESFELPTVITPVWAAGL
jgi:hypothetical protein